MYDHRLLKKATLDALQPPDGPTFHVLATNLTEGGSLWFSPGELRSLGSEEADPELAEPVLSFPLARAVAASSAFPPAFAALRISREDLASPDKAPKLKVEPWLTDGGVFDNTAFNGAMHLDHARRFDGILVSDATAPFDWDYQGRYWFLPRVNRATDILMHRVSLLERAVHHSELRRPENPNGRVRWLLIDREVGQIRTSLDAFSREEIRLLVWSGYLAAAESFGRPPTVRLWDPFPPRLGGLLSKMPWGPGGATPLETLLQEAKAIALRRAQKLRPPRKPDGWAAKATYRAHLVLRKLGHMLFWVLRQYSLLVFLPISVVIVLLLWQSPNPTAALERSSQGAEALIGGLVGDKSCAEFFALAPGGGYVALAKGDARLLHVVDLGHDPHRDSVIDGSEGAASPFFRDNGAEVAFVLGRDLKRADLRESPPQIRTLCERCVQAPLRVRNEITVA
jgi:hypothetical protein